MSRGEVRQRVRASGVWARRLDMSFWDMGDDKQPGLGVPQGLPILVRARCVTP